MARKNYTLELTATELSFVQSSIAAAQLSAEQQLGRPNPTLTRIEKKLDALEETKGETDDDPADVTTANPTE